jgi:hypothetical protein
MGKSTSDTFRDLLGGLTDDLKEAFDDIIDYGEHGRRGERGRRHDRHRRCDNDRGRGRDRDRDRDRDRWDDDRWDDDHWDDDRREPRWLQREDDGGRRRRRDRRDRRDREDPWPPREGGRRSAEEDEVRAARARVTPRTAGVPRQSRRGERGEVSGDEDLRETVEALRSELGALVEALREAPVPGSSTGVRESRRP